MWRGLTLRRSGALDMRTLWRVMALIEHEVHLGIVSETI